MATIKFKNYSIEKCIYKVNSEFSGPNSKGQLELKNSFKVEIGASSGNGYVKIMSFIGKQESHDRPNEGVHTPFYLEVSIRGNFEYSFERADEGRSELKELLSNNAVAILYPYLRAYISTITAQTNQFPAYVLPIANFSDTMKDHDLVSFVGFTDDIFGEHK